MNSAWTLDHHYCCLICFSHALRMDMDSFLLDIRSHVRYAFLRVCLVARVNLENLTSSHLLLFGRSGRLHRALPTSYENNPSDRPG
jgi:hypothetical protein